MQSVIYKTRFVITIHLHFLYSVVLTADNSYYFKARNPEKKLITDLRNSSKGEGDEYLVVTSNWEPKDAE